MKAAFALSTVALATMLVACTKEREPQGASSTDAGAAPPSAEHLTDASNAAAPAITASEGPDPCALVSADEASTYLGPLRHPPYRVGSNGKPLPTGHLCRYEAQTGRRIMIEPTYTDAKMAMKVMAIGGRLMNKVITTDSGQADTLEGRWDEMRVMPGDHLMVRAGDAMVDVDVAGSRAGVAGGAALANIALGRIGKPLSYDGAAAARTAPPPLVTPRNPCSLLTRAEVEAIIGALSKDPEAKGDATCMYTLAQSRGLGGSQTGVAITWRDGFAAMSGAKATSATVVQKVAPGPMAHGTQNGVDTKPTKDAGSDSDFNKFMGQVQGFMKKQGVGVQFGEKGQLANDTTMVGPWDEAALVSGLSFLAVKKDVMVGTDLRVLPYDQAKLLVAKFVERL